MRPQVSTMRAALGLLAFTLFISRSAAQQAPDVQPVPVDLRALQRAQTEEGPATESGTPGIRLQMSSSVGNRLDADWQIESLVYIAPEQIKFRDDRPGCRVANLKWRITAYPAVADADAVQLGDYQVTDLRICGAVLKRAIGNGVVYAFNRLVQEPGLYELRVEIENMIGSAMRTGSITRRVQVPDLSAAEFALSGITLTHGEVVTPPGVRVTTGSKKIEAFYRIPLATDPAIRRFHPGETLTYDLRVFHSAQTEGKDIFFVFTVTHKGRTIHTERIAAAGDRVHGVYHLEASAEPGSYNIAIEAAGAASSSIDFEVVPLTPASPCSLAPVPANAPQPEPSTLPSTLDTGDRLAMLIRVRDRMREAILRIPNFTCTEEIVRSRYAGSPPKRLRMDRARLEVAFADGKELFSWPGDAHFEKDDPSQLVRGGMTTTGDYAYFTRAVFGSDDVRFSRGIEQMLAGHPAVRFDYEIAEKIYEVRYGHERARVALHGSFWVDPATESVLALAVMTTDIPSFIAVSGMTTVLAFRPVVLDGKTYSLPSTAQITAKLRQSGEEVRNQIDFRNCRRFTGESRIIFAAEAEPADVETAQVADEERPLPGRLTLEVTLDEALEARSAVAGAQLSGTLSSALQSGRTRIPAGARVFGRLVQFEFDFATNEMGAAIEFRRVEFDGTSLEFRARLRACGKTQGLRCDSSGTMAQGGRLVLSDGLTRIPAGLRMKWQTVDAR